MYTHKHTSAHTHTVHSHCIHSWWFILKDIILVDVCTYDKALIVHFEGWVLHTSTNRQHKLTIRKQHLKAQDISWQSDESLQVCNVYALYLAFINTQILLPWLTWKQHQCFKRVSCGLTKTAVLHNSNITFMKDLWQSVGYQTFIKHHQYWQG